MGFCYSVGGGLVCLFASAVVLMVTIALAEGYQLHDVISMCDYLPTQAKVAVPVGDKRPFSRVSENSGVVWVDNNTFEIALVQHVCKHLGLNCTFLPV